MRNKVYSPIFIIILILILRIEMLNAEMINQFIEGAKKICVSTNISEDYFLDGEYPSIISLYYMSQYRGGIIDGIALGLSDKDLRKKLYKSLNEWDIVDVFEKNFTDVIKYRFSTKMANINREIIDRELSVLREKEIENFSVYNIEYGSDLIIILRIRKYLFSGAGVELGVEVKLYSFSENRVIFHKIIEVCKKLTFEEATKKNAKHIRKATIFLSRKVGKIFLALLGYANYKYGSKEVRDIKKHEIKLEMDKFSNIEDKIKWQNINLTKEEILILEKEKEKIVKASRDMMRNRRRR